MSVENGGPGSSWEPWQGLSLICAPGVTLTGASELGQQHRTLSWEGQPQLRASTGTRAGQDGAIPEARGAVGAVSQCLPSLELQPCWAQSPWEPMAGPAQQRGIGLIQQDTVAVAVPGALAGDLPWGPGAVWGCRVRNGLEPGTATTPALPQGQPWCPSATTAQCSPGHLQRLEIPVPQLCHGPGPHCAPCCLFSLILGCWCPKKRGQCSPC